jgi:hypothetical protein
LATVSGVKGLCKSRPVGAADSPGPDQAGAHFLNLSHGISFGARRRVVYGNPAKVMA